jgi:hypothetical protein
MTDPQNPQQPPATPPGAYETPAYPPAPPAAPAYSAGGYPAPTGPVPGKTLGIVAFILSFFIQLVALILGIVALVQSKKAGAGNGWAIAAIIISVVGLIIGAIVLFALVIPTVSAAATCAADPNAIVTVWGVEIPCSQVVTTP